MKYKLIPHNFWNELPEIKYKNEWKLPTKKDLKELKKFNNEKQGKI